MSNLNRARCLILRTVKYREADLIVQTLSEQGQRLSFMARGALKSKKRFGGGVLEPTHFVNLQYRESKVADRMPVLEEAAMIRDFRGIRTCYDRLQVGFFIVETALRSSQEGDAHNATLFHLTGNALQHLESTLDVKKFRLHFILRFLYQQGVLEVEEWMEPFLVAKLGEPVVTKETGLSEYQYKNSEKAIERYIKTAEF